MENIRVALRMRPINQREIDGKESLSWNISDGNNIALMPQFQQELVAKKKISQSTKLAYTFDACFSDQDDNWSVYEKVVRPVATSSLEGINGTIFMYGQTGCGKTFTMMGMRQLTDGSKNLMPKSFNDDSDSSRSSITSDKGPAKAEKSTQGILISSLKEIFKEAEEDDSKKYFFRCSYIEIYNDNVHDLLQRNKIKMQEPLKIVEDAQKGEFIIQGLLEENVTNLNEVLDILKQGELNRHFAATAMNHNSSRSHTILMLRSVENKLITKSSQKPRRRVSVQLGQIIDLTKIQGQDETKSPDDFKIGTDSIVADSVLNFVDLAGSEKASIHSEDNRQKEGQHINRSLFFLTQVISMKADKKNDAHIPYRNSPLTKILKTSLGGNSRTLVILALTPAYSQYENSMSTLRFGVSAKKIQNKVSANLTLKADDEAIKLVIAEYENKIKGLQDQLAEEKKKNQHMTSQLAYFENDQGDGGSDSETVSIKKKKKDKILIINRANTYNDPDDQSDNDQNDDDMLNDESILDTNNKSMTIQESKQNSDEKDDQVPLNEKDEDTNISRSNLEGQKMVPQIQQEEIPQFKYGEDIFATQQFSITNLGRVRISEIKQQFERSALLVQPSYVDNSQALNENFRNSSQVTLKPILKQSKGTSILNNISNQEVVKDKMFDIDGIYMTFEEIDRDKKISHFKHFLADYLKDLYKASINATAHLDKEAIKKTDFQILNENPQNQSQENHLYSIKSSLQLDVIIENNAEEEIKMQLNRSQELGRKALSKVNQRVPDSQMGFKNRLIEKCEEIILSRNSSPEPSHKFIGVQDESITNVKEKKSYFDPYQVKRQNQTQMTQQILENSQRLIESLRYGGKSNQTISLPHNQSNKKNIDIVVSQNISQNNSPIRNNQETNDEANPIMNTIYQNNQYFNQSTSSRKKPQSKKLEMAPQQNQSFQQSSPFNSAKPQKEYQNIIQSKDGYQITNQYSPPKYGSKLVQRF